MNHEPTMRRPVEFGPVDLSCSCGWRVANVDQSVAWMRYSTHRVGSAQSNVRGVPTRSAG